MRNKILKFLGGLLAVTLLLNTLPFLSTAHAAAVTINITGITNHTGGTLPASRFVQVIDSTDATKGAPGANGLPVGDTVVAISQINPDGTFSGGASIPSNHYIYIRAWETWDGTGNPPAGTYYGDSNPEDVGSGFVYTYTPPGFSTDKQTAAPAPTITRNPSSFNLNVDEGQNHADETFTVGNSGNATLNYTITDNQNWLSVSPGSGSIAQGGANETHTISFTTDSLAAGGYNATITITDANASNNPQTIAVDLTVGSSVLSISSITPATAEVGQTIVIAGSNFGATKADSVVRFGTTIGNPTVWGETSITVAVPSGFSAGDVTVTVDVGGETDSEIITIAGQKIYIEDYEGGAVGSFTEPATQSGYYVFEDLMLDITPNNANINADLRQAAALHDGAYGAQVMYSYVGTDGSAWGGGWGAQLANVLDLSNTDQVSLFINWDGSTNDVALNLKDSDGTAFAATISNATLMNLGGYGEVTIDRSNFALDEDSSDSGHDGNFDWTEVTNYNFVYKTNGTSTDYHFIDTITANLVALPTGEGIYRIEPPAGPAGTKVAIIGNGFGDVQGMSDLIFENLDTGAWYAATETISWSNTQIEALVPQPASSGNYKVKVIRVTIIQGVTNAWQSNDVDFRVTASAANDGGIANIYPNPFNPLATGANAQAARSTTIAFNNTESRTVGTYIYDMTARLVHHSVTTSSEASWSGYDTHNNLVGDGAYILRVIDEESKRLIAKGKILVIKKK